MVVMVNIRLQKIMAMNTIIFPHRPQRYNFLIQNAEFKIQNSKLSARHTPEALADDGYLPLAKIFVSKSFFAPHYLQRWISTFLYGSKSLYRNKQLQKCEMTFLILK